MVKNIGYWTTRALISALGALGLCAIYYFGIASRPPITWIQSEVLPTVIEPGGTVYVRRKYVLHRDITIEITRKLVQGDCQKSCIIYDLESSTSHNPAGEYAGTRAISIPSNVRPGKYELQFAVHWQNATGYKYTDTHPPLQLEVR